MSKIAIVTTPYIVNYEHYRLMELTLYSLLANKHQQDLDLIAIINSFKGEEHLLDGIKKTFNHCEFNDQNILARAWNKGIKLAFERGADYCLVINLDLIFKTDFIENIVAFARDNPSALIWSPTEWKDMGTLESAAIEPKSCQGVFFSCFMIDRRLFKLVGQFDENFIPAYCEDSDMAYRVRLSNNTMLATSTALLFHFERATLNCMIREKQDHIINALVVNLERNSKRYEQKWGGGPNRETYTQPFNGKEN